MRGIFGEHAAVAYLKPGEVFISRHAVLVSTILGSCVAVTMFSRAKNLGAICHAVYPAAKDREPGLEYVDTVIPYLYARMVEYGGGGDLVVKLFGGASVLPSGSAATGMIAVGDLNVREAERTLAALGLPVAGKDTGGFRGRKILFSIKTGIVFLRRLRSGVNASWPGE